MNIVVCIKQVPGTTEIKIDPETNTLIRQGIENIINPFDTYAIEEGIRLKEAHDGKATVITMGPPQALEAIKEASDLGAGFTVAMRDLEIRGAGEILGARQHGQIAAVGFDLYSRLLAQSVSELRGQEPRTLTKEVRAYTLPLEKQVQINLPLDANLPPEYVADEALRLQLYRRLSGMTTLDEIQEITSELEDRFGPIPELAQNLLYQLRLKALAIQAEVESIVAEHREIVLRSEGLESLDLGVLQRVLGARIKVRRREVRLPLGEEALGDRVTSRNWATVMKLHAMAGG